MGMKKEIRIGTRGSELAVKQAEMVGDALHRVDTGLEVKIVKIKTVGDERVDLPLCEVNKASGAAGKADKGVFTAAIEKALACGEIDCAVHSCKDLPGEIDERVQIAAVPERGDIRDTLVIRRGANMDAPVIGTSSVRRAALVRTYWSGRARTVQLRGNVTTRLRKLVEGRGMDAILLSRAGIDRLGSLRDEMSEKMRLTLVDTDKDSFMPALCQGAIAVETRRGDTDMYKIVRSINHEPSETIVRAERAFLAALGANCSIPVGGYAMLRHYEIELRVVYFVTGEVAIRRIERGARTTPETVGNKVAEELKNEIAKWGETR